MSKTIHKEVYIILTYLNFYGFNLDDFIESNPDPIQSENGWTILLTQKKASFCPICGSTNIYVHDHALRTIRIRHDDSILRFVIKTTRCRCQDCYSSFTPEIKGLQRYYKHSDFTINRIINRCKQTVSFDTIAKENLLTRQRVIQIFDKAYPYIDPLPLPKVMCLDEIRFYTDIETKYVLVITDFMTGKIVDIVESRRYEVMKEYFSGRHAQLKNVKYLVTDMFEGFNTLHYHFFRNIPHIIDLFHVIEDLTHAVNKIRTSVMKSLLDDDGCKSFMKSHWKLFLERYSTMDVKVLDTKYHHEKSNVEKEYYYWMQDCLNRDRTFYHAYSCLQEMYEYTKFSTFEEGERHLNRIINLLRIDNDEDLNRVAFTYEKNKIGIINCLDKKTRSFRYSTGISECINNHIRTLIKVCYGCINFDRFRKRILLISRFNETKRKPGYVKHKKYKHI